MFEWFSRFKSGEMLIDDKPCSGHLEIDENFERNREIILKDRCRTIEEIVE